MREPPLPKPTCREPVLSTKRSHGNEQLEHSNEEQSLLTQLDKSPHAATETQHSKKINRETKLYKKKTELGFDKLVQKQVKRIRKDSGDENTAEMQVCRLGELGKEASVWSLETTEGAEGGWSK